VALKILLADDSMTAQNMGKKILTEAGYEVVAVSNGAAAVKKIAETKPDVVVLDVYMPGYTGLEVCERVKSAIETTKIPVLLTVGKMEPFRPEEGARVKADGVIVKPFEASDLLAAVQKLEQRINSSNSKAGPAKVVVTPAQPPSDEPPEYERTLKIKTPVFDEKDESYQTWKSATAAADEPAPQVPVTGELPEEDFPSAAAEPHTVNVPTEMRASPAMGMEHLGNEVTPDAEQTTTELLERNTAYLERSTSEINPYQIMEEGVDDESTPKSGVGRFFSKAKSWFGGASALEGLEGEEGATATAHDESEAETITLSHGAVEETMETLAPTPRPGPSSAHEHEAAPVHTVGSAHDIDMETAADIHTESKADVAPHAEVSDLHLSAVVSSWEPPQPEPAPASYEPELEVVPSSAQEHIPSGTVPDLEVTSQPSTRDVPAGATGDSMLVTDVNEMSAQFPTRFGVKDAEPVPVGNAADYPELYGHTSGTVEEHASIEDTQEIDPPAELREQPETAGHTQDFEAQVASAIGSKWSEDAAAQADAGLPHTHEAALSGWSAEETHLEENEIGVSLHEEMQQQFSGEHTTVEHELDPSHSLEPTAAAPPQAAAPENGPDAQLAAAMAAAMGTEVTPALTEAVHQAFTGDATIALDKHTAVIAEIVHRVTERMKPELVAEIARELALEVKKEKKKE
jgi:CheY-like chemotaxis protein